MSELYIVPTPIGNLADMVPRALEVLHNVQLIAAEDTRHSGVLLRHFGVSTPMVAFHDHNESSKTPELIQRIQAGEAVALISDAGTPLISDPGYRLVAAAVTAGVKVVPIPGAVAAMAALSAAGFATDEFHFAGFLPAKSGKRKERLADFLGVNYTVLFYESSHRIVACLQDMLAVFGANRRVCVARELTKQFETIETAPLAELNEWIAADHYQQKGEFVVLLEGCVNVTPEVTVDPQRLVSLLAAHLPPNKAAAVTAEVTGVSKKVLYNHLLATKGDSN